MKNRFESPELELILVADVIVTSDTPPGKEEQEIEIAG